MILKSMILTLLGLFFHAIDQQTRQGVREGFCQRYTISGGRREFEGASSRGCFTQLSPTEPLTLFSLGSMDHSFPGCRWLLEFHIFAEKTLWQTGHKEGVDYLSVFLAGTVGGAVQLGVACPVELIKVFFLHLE